MSLYITSEGMSTPSFPRVSGDEPTVQTELKTRISFPRVSGDEPDFLRSIVQGAEFSPREWG